MYYDSSEGRSRKSKRRIRLQVSSSFLASCGNGLNLHKPTLWQGSNCESRSSWRSSGEVLRIHLVHCCKVRNVGQKYSAFHNAPKIRTLNNRRVRCKQSPAKGDKEERANGGLQDVLDVLQHLLSLLSSGGAHKCALLQATTTSQSHREEEEASQVLLNGKRGILTGGLDGLTSLKASWPDTKTRFLDAGTLVAWL